MRDPAGPSVHVLVVEDDEINREVIAGILGRMHAHMTAAENGVVALEIFGRQRFDVVLMDLQMPLMDGYTAVRKIRELEIARGARPTPVVVVSAHDSPSEVRAALTAGADFHLAKPVDLSKLVRTMTSAISSAADGDVVASLGKAG